MLAITRKQAIKKLLQEQKSVTISDLSARLNVTKETIRRDLRAMEKIRNLYALMEEPTYWKESE